MSKLCMEGLPRPRVDPNKHLVQPYKAGPQELFLGSARTILYKNSALEARSSVEGQISVF